MIYVSKSQLSQVEYLLDQSIKGNHVLFDPESLRQIFKEQGKSLPTESHEVEHHIERLILQPTLFEKRAYLESLDPETFEKVVRTYFNIVENNLVESHGAVH